MANNIHLNLLNQGADFWNACRNEIRAKWEYDRQSLTELETTFLKPDLRGAELFQRNLNGFDLTDVDLRMAKIGGSDIREAILINADLSGAELIETIIDKSDLSNSKFREANLASAYLTQCNLMKADFYGADLSNSVLSNSNLQLANLTETNLFKAYFTEANMIKCLLTRTKAFKSDFSQTDLTGAFMQYGAYIDSNFSLANLSYADLSEANISQTIFAGTNVTNTNMRGCRVFGLSAWDLIGTPLDQSNLVITRHGEPEITVDNLKIAQFIYLLINNRNVRDIIDTITSKVVLILGRFSEERKTILDEIRSELRRLNYTPILFDFDKPDSKDVIGTIEILARMARFIIADLTDPSSIPLELGTTVPFLNTTPVLPIKLEGSAKNFTMFDDLRKRYNAWVLDTHLYADLNSLICSLPEVIAPAVERANKLRSEI